MKYLKTFETYQDKEFILKSWTQYYGDINKAQEHYNTFISEVEQKNQNGGNIYRCIFVNSIEEINKEEIGYHWTIEKYYIEDYIDRIKQYYGMNKKLSIVVEAYTEPNNIIICDDLAGNPEEKEINVLDFTKISILNYYLYNNYQLTKI